MKKIYAILFTVLISVSLLAQSPQKMSYQAVVRNSSNQLVASHAIGMKISILQGTSTGTAVYVETQTPNTNANGLVSIEVGGGSVVSGSLSTINWANGLYFIKTEMDPLGGTSYSITGISQLLSVPYALHAKTAESIIAGGYTETDPVFNLSVAKNIKVTDTTRWGNKLSSFTETDPLFNASAAKKIKSTDTTRWSNKQDKSAYYLGQEKDGGVIFYIYKGSDGLEHGLIVAKTESSSLKWQNTAVLVGANRSWDGTFNTNLITDSPVKTYITGLGSGWYLPAIDELRVLFNNRFHVNKALSSIGGSALLSDILYWSSTENQSSDAMVLYMFNSTSASSGKTGTITARAIRAF